MILDQDQARAQCEQWLARTPDESREIFVKRGKGRVATFAASGNETRGGSNGLNVKSQVLDELGHTVRVGDSKGSLMFSASGWPNHDQLHEFVTEAARAPAALELPDRSVVDAAAAAKSRPRATSLPQNSPQSDARRPAQKPPINLNLERSLLSEGEVRTLIGQLVERLEAELHGPFKLTGRVEDGASDSLLLNGHGVEALQNSRVTSLRLELSVGEQKATTYVGGSESLALSPRALAQRLVDVATITEKASKKALPWGRNESEVQEHAVIVTPELMAGLLFCVAPYFLHPPTGDAFSSVVSLFDDPTLAEGMIHADLDGEGVPTRRVRLVRDGEPSGWLRPWSHRDEASTADSEPTGCRFRPGWRDQPRHQISNLVLASSQRPPGEMIEALDRGAFLIGSQSPPRVNRIGEIRMAAIGFQVHQGKMGKAIHTELAISAEKLLSSIAEVARDGRTIVLGSSVRAPTCLLTGVRLLPASTRNQR